MLGSLFGSGVEGTIKGIGDVVDKFVETADEKRAWEKVKLKMQMEPELAQLEINKVEAAHKKVFVAGWRPFIGWVCGVAMAWHHIIHGMCVFVVTIFRPDIVFPALSGQDTLNTVLFALLGFGGFRAYEKVKGVAK